MARTTVYQRFIDILNHPINYSNQIQFQKIKEEPISFADTSEEGNYENIDASENNISSSPLLGSTEINTPDNNVTKKLRIGKSIDNICDQNYTHCLRKRKINKRLYFKCDICFNKFLDETKFKRHKLQYQLGLIKCSICGTMFKRLSMYQKHYNSAHKLKMNAKHLCKCDICGQNFAYKRVLQAHLFHFHKDFITSVSTLSTEQIKPTKEKNWNKTKQTSITDFIQINNQNQKPLCNTITNFPTSNNVSRETNLSEYQEKSINLLSPQKVIPGKKNSTNNTEKTKDHFVQIHLPYDEMINLFNGSPEQPTKNDMKLRSSKYKLQMKSSKNEFLNESELMKKYQCKKCFVLINRNDIANYKKSLKLKNIYQRKNVKEFLKNKNKNTQNSQCIVGEKENMKTSDKIGDNLLEIENKSDSIFNNNTSSLSGIKFSTLKVLNHYKQSLKTNFSCVICEMVFYDNDNLISHMNRTHVMCISKLFELHCRFCQQGFNNQKNLEIHELQFHSKVNKALENLPIIQTENLKLACIKCDIIFTDYKNLIDHNMYYYSEHKVLCRLCDKEFFGLFNINHHFKLTHGSSNKIEQYNFKCDICHEKFKIEAHYHAHIIHVHTDVESNLFKNKSPSKNNAMEDKFVCKVCHVKFSTAHDLEIHNIEFSNNKLPQNFLEQYQLNHKKEEKRYKCKICFVTFSSSIDLYCHDKHIHARTNEYRKSGRTGENDDYECDKCKMLFNTYVELTTHLREFINSGPFICDLCQRRFVTELDLKKHMIRHGLSDHDVCKKHCMICYEEFDTLVDVKVHMLHLHEIQSIMIDKNKNNSNLENTSENDSVTNVQLCSNEYSAFIKPLPSNNSLVQDGNIIGNYQNSNNKNLSILHDVSKSSVKVNKNYESMKCSICDSKVRDYNSISDNSILLNAKHNFMCEACIKTKEKMNADHCNDQGDNSDKNENRRSTSKKVIGDENIPEIQDDNNKIVNNYNLSQPSIINSTNDSGDTLIYIGNDKASSSHSLITVDLNSKKADEIKMEIDSDIEIVEEFYNKSSECDLKIINVEKLFPKPAKHGTIDDTKNNLVGTLKVRSFAKISEN